MSTTVADIQLIEIPKIEDFRGNISVIEGTTIPFKCKRVYYLYDIPSGAKRGGHAHVEQHEVLIALSGSFEVIFKDGTNNRRILLNKPNEGCLIPHAIWRELENFSSGAVCLVFASGEFSEDDYIRDFQDYVITKENVKLSK